MKRRRRGFPTTLFEREGVIFLLTGLRACKPSQYIYKASLLTCGNLDILLAGLWAGNGY
jgi:hypothetical protein